MKEYKFSVVVPIYNVENYLEETIESVINQTIGFKDNIQLILVNDGSKDNSEKICLKYEKKYPDNIVYIKQKNAGVSSARNHGMDYIKGKYVNFLDGDDKWSLNAFENIWTFFEKNYNEIDLVSCRMKFFEAREDYHILDYKFEESKIINIIEDFDFIHLHITSSIIKSSVLKNFKFNSKIKYGEDSNFVNEIILEKARYGVLKEALHFYRKRNDDSSAVQNKEKNISWYTTTVELVYKNLMNLSKIKYGRVLPYIQYMVLYDLQWRIRNKIPNSISKEVKEKYISDVKEILQNIEDYVITAQKSMRAEHKIYALKLKYNYDITNEFEYEKGKIRFKNLPIYSIKKSKAIVKVDFLKIEKNRMYVEGIITTPIPKNDFEIYISDNRKKKYLLDLKDGKKSLYSNADLSFKDDKFLNIYTFKVDIPLEKVKKIFFIFSYRGETESEVGIKFGKFSGLYEKKGVYKIYDKYILKYIKGKISIVPNTFLNRLKWETKYLKRLTVNEHKFYVVGLRFLYFITKTFNKKEIWLISDREDRANDNGEHFFKYVCKVKNKKIKPYFVISKKSHDYNNIKKIGKVVDPESLKYKVLFLRSSKIISSQANDNVINAFEKDNIYFRNLFNFRFIFLQHGITTNDLSSWLKKRDKNISIFITSAKAEYNSIINGDYYYSPNEVKLTGFARYDTLVNKSKKSVLILPTQRRKLVEWCKDDVYGKKYNPKFKESDFFKFYDNLINDKRLLESLKNHGYKLKFGLHPLLLKQSEDFTKNDMVEMLGKDIDYQKEFNENSIMITDYSSVSYDFAYLRKPVIYAQFDKQTFYEGQVYEKGYFDFEKDGFGPVCYDYSSTVNEIIKLVENDAKLEDVYLKRINDFYEFDDKNNCKRIYEAIIQ